MSSQWVQPWVWIILFALLCLVIDTILNVTAALWRSRRQPPPSPPPYDWQLDDGWLDVIARDDQGEVTAILPVWNWKIGGGTREW